MEISTTTVNNWIVASLHGAFTIKKVNTFQKIIDQALEMDHPLLAIDVSNVPFLDSSALGKIITAHKSISQKGGYVCVFGANEPISKIFETVRLPQRITIYKDFEEFKNRT
ncbi:STAS domain-containing protein [Chitinivibrio alkaliphilus]|uniref:Anti-sigma factor antagonist n=1 Tax=Chitinivibrio alkaliphilus ACht1 TaxID=1313304 RepID=U7DCH3_9BACT|nr:STAS domain-containing protein [Chitinivibrio alkaliphilus]ERP32130.1 anti-sigma factor antagonist [Chitinivibrio alkaliphilus ACht1]